MELTRQEKVRINSRNYYLLHKDEVLEKNREYRRKHPEFVKRENAKSRLKKKMICMYGSCDLSGEELGKIVDNMERDKEEEMIKIHSNIIRDFKEGYSFKEIGFRNNVSSRKVSAICRDETLNGKDSILCKDKADAHKVIDTLNGLHIDDFEYLPTGEIRIFLDCKLDDIKENNHDAGN